MTGPDPYAIAEAADLEGVSRCRNCVVVAGSPMQDQLADNQVMIAAGIAAGSPAVDWTGAVGRPVAVHHPMMGVAAKAGAAGVIGA